jgi:uncharacterized RDD family membrane protein YckC
MSYWCLLGLEETADLRAIKQAYATRLKKTKPDEDPEGFKQLHAAYKWACQYAKANPDAGGAVGQRPGHGDDAAPSAVEPQSGVPLPTPPQPLIETEASKPAAELGRAYYQSSQDYFLSQGGNDASAPDAYREELEQIASTDNEEEFTFLQGQWAALTAGIDQATATLHTINDLRSWRFLDGREALFDLQFKAEISYYTFERIVRRLVEDGRWNVVKKPVFDYLNGLFRWSDQRDMLEQQFDIDAVESVLHGASGVDVRLIKWTSPKQHAGVLVYAGYYPRLFSALLDWFLFGFGASLLYKLAALYLDVGGSEQADWVIAGLLAYGLVAPFMEATPLQGTPGKILFNMKVVTPRGRRLNVFHAYWRGLLFGIATAMFKFTVWINLFLRDGRLLHDRLSRSIVVKR